MYFQIIIMLRTKKIDAIGQVLLIAGFVLGSLISRSLVFAGYFIVGGWQLVSMFVHMSAASKMPLHTARNFYQKIILALAIIGVAALTTGTILYFLIALLYGSPLLAVWYAWFSSRELQVWQAKDLVHLKN